MSKRPWSENETEWLRTNYPAFGKSYCVKELNRSPAAVRGKASDLDLKLNRNSEHYKQAQKNAGSGRLRRRRPRQSEIMRRKWQENPDYRKWTEEDKAGVSSHFKTLFGREGHPRGFLGKKHTAEARDTIKSRVKEALGRFTSEDWDARADKMMGTKIANRTVNSLRGRNNAASIAVGGRRPDLGEVYFRSSTEANYARFLNFCGVKWEYEPRDFYFEGIRRGCVSYTPDFWLPNEDRWIEVKGWFDQKSVTKLDRFKRFFPDEFKKLTLVVMRKKGITMAVSLGINYESYEEIGKKLGRVIPNWESKPKNGKWDRKRFLR